MHRTEHRSRYEPWRQGHSRHGITVHQYRSYLGPQKQPDLARKTRIGPVIVTSRSAVASGTEAVHIHPTDLPPPGASHPAVAYQERALDRAGVARSLRRHVGA